VDVPTSERSSGNRFDVSSSVKVQSINLICDISTRNSIYTTVPVK